MPWDSRGSSRTEAQAGLIDRTTDWQSVPQSQRLAIGQLLAAGRIHDDAIQRGHHRGHRGQDNRAVVFATNPSPMMVAERQQPPHRRVRSSASSYPFCSAPRSALASFRQTNSSSQLLFYLWIRASIFPPAFVGAASSGRSGTSSSRAAKSRRRTMQRHRCTLFVVSCPYCSHCSSPQGIETIQTKGTRIGGIDGRPAAPSIFAINVPPMVVERLLRSSVRSKRDARSARIDRCCGILGLVGIGI